MRKIKVALFDVDKTIIKGDSMFKLIGYTIRKYPKAILESGKLVFNLIKYKLGIINTIEAKEHTFYTLKYISKQELKVFYDTVIKRHVYLEAEKKMKELHGQGYKIILVSASPECYLKYFEEEEFIDCVIGTLFHEDNGMVINKIIGENCKGEEKVKRVNKYLGEQLLQIDKENSIAFSDSLSDIPMFNLVGKAYLINYNKNHKEYEVLKWK